jgi:hypothetical protein
MYTLFGHKYNSTPSHGCCAVGTSMPGKPKAILNAAAGTTAASVTAITTSSGEVP